MGGGYFVETIASLENNTPLYMEAIVLGNYTPPFHYL